MSARELLSARALVPATALAVRLEFADDMLDLYLTGGRILGVPLARSPRLLRAAAEPRQQHKIGGGGRSVRELRLAGRRPPQAACARSGRSLARPRANCCAAA